MAALVDKQGRRQQRFVTSGYPESPETPNDPENGTTGNLPIRRVHVPKNHPIPPFFRGNGIRDNRRNSLSTQ